ncbi:MAG: ATP-dependent sacrificial sulfur transferase LarE [Pseudomonadales bacterium]|nr:ATP-dependent sacrificial sulfur transferase LarE [Pseudomonadales bacterium]
MNVNNSTSLTKELADKHRSLCKNIGSLGRVVVAFSGGIDSSLVAHVAASELGENALIATSGSASLKRSDLSLTQHLADRWKLNHRVITTDELSKTEYRANPTNRCFYCKTSLYAALQEIAEKERYDYILNGTNTDDLGDHRPGLQAANDFNIRSPLVETGFCKSDIRALAEHLGLENAQKPQAACLSSRFPYGSHITRERLAQVEAAENVLAALGFTQYRVRHHEEVARIEIVAQEMPHAIEVAALIDERVRACGYRFVSLDLGGFRSGALNEGGIPAVQVHEPA